MVHVTCINKLRDKNNRIVGYVIKDKHGKEMEILSESLKKHIISGDIKVDNLTLTSDGRLIDKGRQEQEIVKYIGLEKNNKGIEAYYIIEDEQGNKRRVEKQEFLFTLKNGSVRMSNAELIAGDTVMSHTRMRSIRNRILENIHSSKLMETRLVLDTVTDGVHFFHTENPKTDIRANREGIAVDIKTDTKDRFKGHIITNGIDLQTLNRAHTLILKIEEDYRTIRKNQGIFTIENGKIIKHLPIKENTIKKGMFAGLMKRRRKVV